MTGCERITHYGLEALIAGTPFVEKGLSFVGFKPVDGHVAIKLEGHLTMMQDEANRQVVDRLRREREGREAQEEAWCVSILYAFLS
jgi:hypothetical protein